MGGWGRPVACFGVQPTSFRSSGLRRPLAGGIRCISEDQTAPASFFSAGCRDRSQRANCEKALGRVRGSCRGERVVSVFNPPNHLPVFSAAASSVSVCAVRANPAGTSAPPRDSPAGTRPARGSLGVFRLVRRAHQWETHTHTSHISHTQAKLIY